MILRFDRLCIDQQHTRRVLAASLLAQAVTQVFLQLFDDAALAPLAEVIVHRLPGTELSRQSSPGATLFQQIEQSVDNLTQRTLSLTSRTITEYDESDSFPLGISQVCAVALPYSGLHSFLPVVYSLRVGNLPDSFSFSTTSFYLSNSKQLLIPILLLLLSIRTKVSA